MVKETFYGRLICNNGYSTFEIKQILKFMPLTGFKNCTRNELRLDGCINELQSLYLNCFTVTSTTNKIYIVNSA